MIRKLHVQEGGFTLIELLVTIAILGVLFGIVSLTLAGVGANAETTVNTAELGVVQSAVDVYMAVENLSTIAERTSGAVIDSGDSDADFNIYLRHMPTKCEYSWDTAGVVTQTACP